MIYVATQGIFINTNNTVFAPRRSDGTIFTWENGNASSMKSFSTSYDGSLTLFMSFTGDVYADNGGVNNRVTRWTTSTNISTTVMYPSSNCHGLFLDIADTIYCSIPPICQVLKKPINTDPYLSMSATGTGCCGTASNQLNGPRGIFVDTNFDLYVADYWNDRVQRFTLGGPNGTTVAGSKGPGNFSLNNPSGVFLDGNGYLFIVDSFNNRIVGSGPGGFRCIAGCLQSNGSSSSELSSPSSMSFDSYGNVFVTDLQNNRIQKFTLASNSCSKFSSRQVWVKR